MGLLTPSFSVYLVDTPNGLHLISSRKPRTWCGRVQYDASMHPFSPFEKLEQDGPDYLRGLDLCPDCRARLDWIAEHRIPQVAEEHEVYIV